MKYEQCILKQISEEVVENNEVTAGVSRREILPLGEISFGQANLAESLRFCIHDTETIQYRGAFREENKKPYSIVTVLRSTTTLLQNLLEGKAVLKSLSNTTVKATHSLLRFQAGCDFLSDFCQLNQCMILLFSGSVWF